MKLRGIRIFLATLFLVATMVYLIIGPKAYFASSLASVPQLMPSIVTTTIGTSLFWLIMTFVFGRVYCSAVCPVGIFSDLLISLRKRSRKRPPIFSYKEPKMRLSTQILIGFVVALMIGINSIPFAIEPWNIVRNLGALHHPSPVESTWLTLGVGVTCAFAIGFVMLLLISVIALLRGRKYCTEFCPIGAAMGLLEGRTIYHIEIDPDRCTSCGLCEDQCAASCIKVAERLVDDGRCVRCFDCLNVCKDDAIHFQINRNRRPATPLLQKREKKLVDSAR